MKAVFILDHMPAGCSECQFREAFGGYSECGLNRHILPFDLGINAKPSWCPLRPLPQRKETDGHEPFEVFMHREGWNECIDAITGETE